MLKQRNGRLFDYDPAKAVADIVPVLSLRPTPAGWRLGEKLQAQLQGLQKSGRYAQIMRQHAMPEWHVRDGLNGKFTLTRSEDCPLSAYSQVR